MKKIEGKFTRPTVKGLSEELQSRLDSIAEELGVRFSVTSARFSDDRCSFKIDTMIVGKTGDRIISPHSNGIADRTAAEKGISLKARHLIGSVWRIKGTLCQVVDYKPRNRTYPIIVTDSDGKRLKATWSSLHDEVMPAMDEFKKWFTIDPDDDRVSKRDEEACDRVAEYMDFRFSPDVVDVCCDIYETGKAEMFWEAAYSLMFSVDISVDEIYETLKEMVKEATKFDKSKKSRK